jgi:alkanesulfonate monooxygenase SsuD/methylene tetrahydromethanopterin reductase-like flavin-dependent oxidoreductase (luciferase family)
MVGGAAAGVEPGRAGRPGPRVGIVPPGLGRGARALRAALEAVAAAGIDRVVMGDHVSFRGGFGVDGLVSVAAMAAAHPSLEVATGVYLLPLRHPVAVARQVATIADLAPGRLVLGVGVGGEDPAELAACGVDPATRGRRMDEALTILRRLLAGEVVSLSGRFFTLEGVRVLPAPEPPVPILVGGRSDAAVVRAGRLGDGWLAIWVSPERFAAAVERAGEAAADAGRAGYPAEHALQVWCGFGDDADAGRRRWRRRWRRSTVCPSSASSGGARRALPRPSPPGWPSISRSAAGPCT